MKKAKKFTEQKQNNIVQEAPSVYYTPPRKIKQVNVKDFYFTDFQKIADKSPFTLGEWADILHISLRTLQRHAHDNTAFKPLQIERILQIQKLILIANSLFSKEEFHDWLDSKVFSLQNNTPKSMLTSYEGIQDVINILGRMQHGIPA